MPLLDQIAAEEPMQDVPRIAVDRCGVLVARYFRNHRAALSWKTSFDDATASSWLRTVVPFSACRGVIARNEAAVYLRTDKLVEYVTVRVGGERVGEQTFMNWLRDNGLRKESVFIVPPTKYDGEHECVRMPLDVARGDILLRDIDSLEHTIIQEYLPCRT